MSIESGVPVLGTSQALPSNVWSVEAPEVALGLALKVSLCVFLTVAVCVVHHWVRSQLLPVRHPEEVAPLHEYQEHHPEGL